MNFSQVQKSFKKIIEYGMYLLVFLLPWQTRFIFSREINGEFWEYGSFSIYGTEILLLFLLILAISFKLKNQEKHVENKKFNYLICGFLSIIFLSSVWALDYKLSLFFGLRILEGIGIFWLLTSFNFSRVKIAWSLVLAGFSQSILAIWQFASQNIFACKWLGMSVQDPSALGVSVVETIGGRFLRSYGSLSHPNILAGFLVICLLLCIWLLTTRSLHFAPACRFGRDDKEKAFLIFIFFTLLLGLFLTFSRAAWLAFLVSMIIILFWLVKKKNFKLIKNLLIPGILFLIILGAIFQSLILTRFSLETRLEIKSNQERVSGIKQAKELSKKYFYHGLGAGNYTLGLYELNKNFQVWEYQPVHNVYLLILVELGIIGLVIFLLFILEILKWIWKKSGGDDFEKMIITIIIISILIMMLFDHWWWTMYFGIIFFAVVLGFMCKKNNYV